MTLELCLFQRGAMLRRRMHVLAEESEPRLRGRRDRRLLVKVILLVPVVLLLMLLLRAPVLQGLLMCPERLSPVFSLLPLLPRTLAVCRVLKDAR
jgi:hypothetical protein